MATGVDGSAHSPLHPEPMMGRQNFPSMSDALNFFSDAPKGSTLNSLTLVIKEYKDFTEDALKRVARMRKP